MRTSLIPGSGTVTSSIQRPGSGRDLTRAFIVRAMGCLRSWRPHYSATSPAERGVEKAVTPTSPGCRMGHKTIPRRTARQAARRGPPGPDSASSGREAPTMTLPLPEDNAVRRLHAEYATVRALAEAGSLPDAAHRILECVCETFGWEYGGLWRVDPTGGVLRCVEAWHSPSGAGRDLSGSARQMTFEPSHGLPGRVWSRNEPVWIPDVKREDDFPCARRGRGGRAPHRPGGPRSASGTASSGSWSSSAPRSPSPTSSCSRCSTTIGSQIGQFVEHKRTEEELATLFQMSRDMLCIADFEGYLPPGEPRLGEDARLHRGGADRPVPTSTSSTPTTATPPRRGRERRGGAPLLLFENRYRCKDGSYRWISWNATPGPGGASSTPVARRDRAEAGGGGAAAGPRRRRGREPGQERLPGQHEPRDPHPDERGDRHDRAAPGHPARAPSSASTPSTVQDAAESLLGRHQRHPRLLEDRGRASSSSSPAELRPAGGAAGTPLRTLGRPGAPEGPRARRAEVATRGARPPGGRRRPAAPGPRQPGGQRHQVHRAAARCCCRSRARDAVDGEDVPCASRWPTPASASPATSRS